MTLQEDWKELSDLQDQFVQLQHDYFSCRYKLWQKLFQIKKQSPLKISYKDYQAMMRRDFKRKQRKGCYEQKRKGYEQDHKLSLLWCYLQGIEDPDVVNAPENIQLIPRKTNRDKSFKNN